MNKFAYTGVVLVSQSGKWPSPTIETVVSNHTGLADTLTRIDPDGDAQFNLVMDSDDDYPTLVLCVSQSRWYLHFWPRGGVPGFHSLGDDSSDETIHLPAEDNIWVPASALVDAATALEAAEQFMDTGQQPTCLSWFEL